MYFQSYIIDYLKVKFLSFIQNEKYNFSKKVFISRLDASARKIFNEDEIFSLFESKGFKRYLLGKMSISEQVALFNGAEIIIAPHGAGLVNLMFCNPETKVVEIFQARSDSCFYYLSQSCNLQYYFIQTTEFKKIEESGANLEIPLQIIKNFIESSLLFDMQNT